MNETEKALSKAEDRSVEAVAQNVAELLERVERLTRRREARRVRAGQGER